MTTITHIDQINPPLRGWRVILDRQPLEFVIAPSRAEAIRIARFSWAASHRTTFANAPECVLIRRAD